MNIIKNILHFIENNPYIVVIGATCIIQIAPIEINPWTKLFRWMGKQINEELEKKVNALEKKFDSFNDEISDERVQNKRWHILNFTNSCRQKILHTKEEWDHCLEELRWYEKYCEDNDIPNGVIEESAAWLRRRYKEHLDNHDFLQN